MRSCTATRTAATAKPTIPSVKEKLRTSFLRKEAVRCLCTSCR